MVRELQTETRVRPLLSSRPWPYGKPYALVCGKIQGGVGEACSVPDVSCRRRATRVADRSRRCGYFVRGSQELHAAIDDAGHYRRLRAVAPLAREVCGRWRCQAAYL